MSGFCTNCGAALEDDAAFCPECGTRIENAAQETVPEAQAAASAAAAEAPSPEEAVPVPPAPVPEETPAPGPEAASAPERSKEISTAGYFWLMLLFHIPIIGLIAVLILGLTGSNRNLRNYARAHLAWIAVMIVLTVILYIVTRIIVSVTGNPIDWQSLFQSFRDLLPIK